MKTIKQTPFDLDVNFNGNYCTLIQKESHIGVDNEYIEINKQGAKQLIEVLKEWVGENG